MSYLYMYKNILNYLYFRNVNFTDMGLKGLGKSII